LAAPDASAYSLSRGLPRDLIVTELTRRPKQWLPRSVHDPSGSLRLISFQDERFVLKYRDSQSAHQESARAAQAAACMDSIRPTVPLQVVVPQHECLDSGCALITPFLGQTLADPAASEGDRRLTPTQVREAILCLLQAGVEFSGFVPRNIFGSAEMLSVIDWEDCKFRESPTRPDSLTVVKWDIAWADYFSADIGLRHSLEHTSFPPPPADVFDVALASVLSGRCDPSTVHSTGLRITLDSEMFVAGATHLSAAEVGHFATDVLSPLLQVFHAAACALVRNACGEAEFGRLIACIAETMTGDTRNWTKRWISDLVLVAAEALHAGTGKGEESPARAAVRTLSKLQNGGGWSAAKARAIAAEEVILCVWSLLKKALPVPEVQLLLRGSVAQGLMTLQSDIDFELSSPAYPHGLPGLEDLIVEVLECLDLRSEGSRGRPQEQDLVSSDGRLTRDLHEFLQLRPAGAVVRDGCWPDAFFSLDATKLSEPSEYERLRTCDDEPDPWFEARALVTRLYFRSVPSRTEVLALLDAQLTLLRAWEGDVMTSHVRTLLEQALACRETPDMSLRTALSRKIEDFRGLHDIPGASAINLKREAIENA
jgi:hypothetical protein